MALFNGKFAGWFTGGYIAGASACLQRFDDCYPATASGLAKQCETIECMTVEYTAV